MKITEKVFTKKEPVHRLSSKQKKMQGGMLIAILVVWLGLFLLIRLAFRIGGNPLFTFAIMIGLLFVALGLVRYSYFYIKPLYNKAVTKINALLAGFKPK